MSPELGRIALRIAMFSVVVSTALLPFLDRHSAEFVITAASLIMGLFFIGLIWLVLRYLSK